jgi:hypothetical protein
MSEATNTTETPAAPKAKRVKKAKTRKVTYFAFVRDIAGDEKLNKQQQVIVDNIRALADANGGKADRAALLAILTPEVLMTRQKPAQVLGFYMAGWKKDNALFTSTVEDVIVEPAA